MPSYRVSRSAANDIRQVYFYSFKNFGEMHAHAYVAGLGSCFQLLAEQPFIGPVRPGKTENLRTFFHSNHIVAYRIMDDAILIQRVLDARRDWQRALQRK